MNFTTRPELVGSFGMVASTHWLASAAGMAVLEAGGNAFDAATAAGLVLQVAEPHLNGPGGEVPIIGFSADDERPFVVCGQGGAPGAATLEAYGDLGIDLIPGTGLLAACVPGAFDGWMTLLGRYGTMHVRDVMRYAIEYAHIGIPVLPSIARSIEAARPLFEAAWPSSASVYLRGGRTPRSGSSFANVELAETYERVLSEAEAASSDRDAQIEAARAAFYEGFVADAIAAFCSEPAEDDSLVTHRGFLTGDDLARWHSPIEDPVGLDYQGLRVLKCGPWSQGPVFLQQLALLDGSGLADMGLLSADYIHTVVECAKLAFADREAFYGDPARVDVPLDTLLSGAYANERRGLVGPVASMRLVPGSPDGISPRMPVIPTATGGWGTGEPTLGPRQGDTCHVDVVDRFGNMVAATPSGGWLMSSPVIPGLGFPLGTRAQMFWLEEGLPNSLAAGKRPRTTLSPSLALRDGRPALAFGTPGGDSQDQWTLQFFLAHVHYGLNLQEAIDAPEFHTTHFPSSFFPRDAHPGELLIESRVGGTVLAELTRRGHHVEAQDPWSLGRVSAVSRDEDGTLRAGANARGMQGYAAGR
ncbi:MAG: gamma-glutamyltranspeptidase / glutathione hydrolase [Actinomycetota bacterium]|nr:gamma-glutamyltranspeptidase / glutathione hydrolase [Actinomycetota bacterium]